MSKHALLMDYYELTMANSFFEHGKSKEWAVFDYYFRQIPDSGGYAIFAGLETLLSFIETWRFDADDIEFLNKKGVFSAGFLDYLKNFRFQGEIYAFPEGSAIFPNEPIVSVRAPLIECQLLETMLLLTLNHQSLIATKAARMCLQAQGKPIFEFGSRRAHGIDAALYGARAAYIGGIAATANTEAEQMLSIPAVGTMAHSYVQSFDDEYRAFAAYAENYPHNTVLLVDTYNTLKSGIPNAIRVHQEILAPRGAYLKGIRIDSGDLAYLSNRARQMLDAAGLTQTQITVSNALDEYVIQSLLNQGAAIDAFGIGERLITARSEPIFGGVYKIAALEKSQETVLPKIKLSENMMKTTTPAFKQVYRLYDEQHAVADLVTLRHEPAPVAPYLLFDPDHPWKQKHLSAFHAKPMLNLVWQNGAKTAPSESLTTIRKRVNDELASLWAEIKRLDNPHGYYVDFSNPLWSLKQKMITDYEQCNQEPLQ